MSRKTTRGNFFYLLFDVIHPLPLSSDLSTRQSETSKPSTAKRARDHSLKRRVQARCAPADATHTCSPAQAHVQQGRTGSQGEDKRAVAEGKTSEREEERDEEREREGREPENGTTF